MCVEVDDLEPHILNHFQADISAWSNHVPGSQDAWLGVEMRDWGLRCLAGVYNTCLGIVLGG